MKLQKKWALPRSGEEILENLERVEKEELMEVGGMEQNDQLTQGFEKGESCQRRKKGRHGLTRKATVKKSIKDRKVKVTRRKKAGTCEWY